MSNIDASVFRNWNNGDTMNEADYEQEREILRTAINDNYARLIKQYQVLNPDGTVKTTQSLTTALNTIKFKEGSNVQLSLDTVTSTLTLAVSLGSNTVGTANIIDGNVTTIKLADGSITTVKIADGNVTNTKLSLSSVSTDKIIDSAVTTAKIANGAVNADKLDPALMTTNVDLNQHRTTSVIDHPDGSVTRAKLSLEVQAELKYIRSLAIAGL